MPFSKKFQSIGNNGFPNRSQTPNDFPSSFLKLTMNLLRSATALFVLATFPSAHAQRYVYRWEPTISPAPTETAIPSPSPSDIPTLSPAPTITGKPTQTVSAPPTVTSKPTESPTESPAPSPSPSDVPSVIPSASPSSCKFHN